MSFNFGERSESRLATVNHDLVMPFRAVIGFFDFTVICGWRGKEAQTAAYEMGFSTKEWGESDHNFVNADGVEESHAIDVAPWYIAPPHIRWKNEDDFKVLAGRVLQVGDELGIPMIWGGDWDGDNSSHDQTFMDVGHFAILLDF